MKNTIISLGLFKDYGGPTKTINAFKSALNAELFCFCSPHELKQKSLAVEGAQPVVSSRFPLLRQMRYASLKESSKVETAFARSRMVSCHSFYRYHALWVNQMSRRYGVPYWFVPHGILDPWLLEYRRLPKKLFWKLGGQRFLDNACTVIFSTKAERDKASSQFKLPGSEVIPWPVELVRVDQRDSDWFTSAATESVNLAANFGPKIWAKRLEEILEAV